MAKAEWKPGNMLYPLPVVMVSVADEEGHDNIITVAWAGTVCTNPPMVSISVRPERYSYQMLLDTREFVINLTTEKLAFATDYCGVKSGREVDKFKELHLTREKASHVGVPMIGEAPVSIECRVREIQEYGSHSVLLQMCWLCMWILHTWMKKASLTWLWQILLFIPMGNITDWEKSWEPLDIALRKRERKNSRKRRGEIL